MKETSYLLLRLAIGFSFFGHGLVRLPKLHSFSDWMVNEFSKSIIPAFLVKLFSYLIPFAEFTIGLLCILGLFTEAALVAGSIEIILLILGSCLIENWELIVSQLLHVAISVGLLQFIKSNTWAIDKLF